MRWGRDVIPSSLQSEWARLLLASLRQAGVRDVVISPGARSTPFVWAALRDPGLRCRTIIDERSAAFFAVGHAKMTGDPVLLVCTSGSAAANYFPAVVEAAEAGTPLLLLTADRGLELQHAAAPQTIDQTRLYGGHVRLSLELGAPDPHPRMLRAVQRLAAQAVLAARGPVPGPVHMNARARKPLGPVQDTGAEADRLRDEIERLVERGPATTFTAPTPPSDAALSTLAAACREARRGLIVCGPALPCEAPDPALVVALARATGFPVVAEPASQQRFGASPDGAGLDPEYWVDGFAALLAVPRFREDHGPDLVIQLGRPPTASEWGDYLDRWTDTARHVVAPHGWPDPWSTATAVVRADVGATVRALARALTAGLEEAAALDVAAGSDSGTVADRRDWRQRLQQANRTAWRAIEAALADGFAEGAAVRVAVESVPEGGILAVGNSLAIREAELFVPAAARGIAVWAQRGANGIDGLVSGAAGAAIATGRPTTLVLGDVSFVHDLTGLAVARDTGAQLTVVVLNNGGGRIFERLPMAEGLAGTEDFDAWLTPPGLDVAGAAAAFGVACSRATSRDELADALRAARGRGTVGVVEVVVPPDGTTTHQRRLAERLAAELSP
jgi:2-succinyl-5-enolpyruvyl-6-hydroxy-3-cyclohexene-1-carboxylate synthase